MKAKRMEKKILIKLKLETKRLILSFRKKNKITSTFCGRLEFEL